MDVVSTVQSLCSLAVSLLTWLEQTKEKEETVLAISGTVARIYTVLSPFQNTPDLDPSLVAAFLGLGDVLSRTKEHLLVWGNRRRRNSVSGIVGFLVPAQVTKLLSQDEQQLSHQLIIILFSLATISFFRDRYPIPAKGADNFALSSVKNQDVFEFWRDYLGAKVSYARSERFLEALKLCFGDWLSERARRRLAFRLDEFRVGGVAMSSLERFVGNGSLKQAVEQFKVFDQASAPVIDPRSDPRLPLIIWVDDNPNNNVEEVTFARNNGVKVIEFTSTALAKAWIEENEDFLRENDSSNSIRFISDTARFETSNLGDNVYLNISAGENIVRYLRGHLYRAPVLIFCGSSGIAYTEYVQSYEAAGSTHCSEVVLCYISALAQRSNNDGRWQGFHAT